MQPLNLIDELIAMTTAASHIMHTAGLTDTEVGMHLDLMMEVLDAYHMPIPTISHQRVIVPGIFVGIVMHAHVPIDDDETLVEMNVELVQLFQTRDLSLHEAFALVFVSRSHGGLHP